MKKIVIVIMILAMAMLVLSACGGGNGNDNDNQHNHDHGHNHHDHNVVDEIDDLDGTWAHGAETIVFDGQNFEVLGGAGHRHLPDGTGTFELQGNEMAFMYDDGETVLIGFSFDGNIVRIAGHGYRRQ